MATGGDQVSGVVGIAEGGRSILLRESKIHVERSCRGSGKMLVSERQFLDRASDR